MVIKTKKLNKQRNKHRNKYTSTKSKVSRRTRKNDLVLRGGGDDVEIYYKTKKGNTKVASEDTTYEIFHETLKNLPTIKINANGKYKIMFSYIKYAIDNKLPNIRPIEIITKCYERTGILFHSTNPISCDSNQRDNTDAFIKACVIVNESTVQLNKVKICIDIYKEIESQVQKDGKTSKEKKYSRDPIKRLFIILKPVVK